MKGRSRFRFRYRGIMSALGGIIDTTSKLLLDLFANDFEVANEVSTFNQTVSHSASTNGTMTGSDGTIKWRPHNLLLGTSDFSAGWVTTNAAVEVNSTVAPDGSNTAAKLSDNATLSYHR